MKEKHQNIEELAKMASLLEPSEAISEIADENDKLVCDIGKFDPKTSIPLLASLLTLPKYQSQCIRIETLVALAVTYSTGKKKAYTEDLRRWYSSIAKSSCVQGEDPSEDIFVHLVNEANSRGYRILGGIWESPGLYTQMLLNVLGSIPDTESSITVKRHVHVLLRISDMICDRARLQRYEVGSDSVNSTLSFGALPHRNDLLNRVTFSVDQLKKQDIGITDLEPFFLNKEHIDSLKTQHVGCSFIESHPLIKLSDSTIAVIMPSAISVALRQYILKFFLQEHSPRIFDQTLASCYTNLFLKSPLIGVHSDIPIGWQEIDSYRISSISIEIDTGYYLTYCMFLPPVNIDEYGCFASPLINESIHTILHKYITQSVEIFTQKQNFKKGIVLLVGCGYGKGYMLNVQNFNYPNWYFEHISAADLTLLSNTPKITPSLLFQLKSSVATLEEKGIRFMNPSGILNLIGWMHGNNDKLVPTQLLPEEIGATDTLLSIPSNSLKKIRIDTNRKLDKHILFDEKQCRHEIQRFSSNPHFENNDSNNLYISISDSALSMLTAVYEGKHNYWLSVLNSGDQLGRELVWNLFEMAIIWLSRICIEIDRVVSQPKVKKNIKLYITFLDESIPREVKARTESDLTKLCKIESVNKEQNTTTLYIQKGFLAGFANSENIAEKVFTSAMLSAYLGILEIENSKTVNADIIGKVFPNTQARYLHSFYPRGLLEHISQTLPNENIIANKLSEETCRIGLAWKVRKVGNFEKILEREECTKFLNSIVSVLQEEICQTLSKFDRLICLKKLIQNIEKTSFEKNRWLNTSHALIGLRGDSQNTTQSYVEHSSNLESAIIASRVLVEIALCECPFQGGMDISNIELSELISKTLTIMYWGGTSNAIYYNIVPPKIEISRLGEIIVQDDFDRDVVNPHLIQGKSDMYMEASQDQAGHYSEPKVGKSAKETMGAEFWEIWIKEFGFSIDQARIIIGLLGEVAKEKESLCYYISQQEYYEIVCSQSISKEVAQCFLDRFALKPRDRWQTPPAGFKKKDIVPWKYGRRLSYVSRPILFIEDTGSSRLLIAPSALENSFIYICHRTFTGRLSRDFYHRGDMRDKWLGKASSGHPFNQKVAETMANTGWTVRSNINIPEILQSSTAEDLGDIDVLAWKPDGEKILIIECKDIDFARNHSEIANQLIRYQGVEKNGKLDHLKKHLRRVETLEKNITQLRKFTKLKNGTIVSCLVFSRSVPMMQYAKIPALETTHVGPIENILKLG